RPQGGARRAWAARGHHPFRRQRGPESRRRAFRVTPVPALGAEVPRRGSRLLPWLGRAVLALLGWRIVGEVPNVPKFVIAVAPHTSDWDFVVGVAAMFALDFRLAFLGKHTLFAPPFGAAMRWL